MQDKWRSSPKKKLITFQMKKLNFGNSIGFIIKLSNNSLNLNFFHIKVSIWNFVLSSEDKCQQSKLCTVPNYSNLITQWCRRSMKPTCRRYWRIYHVYALVLQCHLKMGQAKWYLLNKLSDAWNDNGLSLFSFRRVLPSRHKCYAFTSTIQLA